MGISDIERIRAFGDYKVGDISDSVYRVWRDGDLDVAMAARWI